MLKTRTMGVCAAMLPAVSGLAQAVWTNQGGTSNWMTPQNWSTQQVPNTLTSAIVPAGFGTVVSTGGFDVRSIYAESPLYLSGAVAGRWWYPSTIKDASIFGGLMSESLMTFTGNVQVQNAYSWVGLGGYKNTGTFTVVALPVATTFLNEGTMRVSGTYTVAGPESVLTNEGTLELLTSGSLYSSGVFHNHATFRKTGAGISTVQTPTELLGGSLDVQAGTLAISGGTLFQGGTVTVAGSALLKLETPSVVAHKFLGAPVSGGGDLQIQSMVGQPAPVQILADQTFNLTGPVGLHLLQGNASIAAEGVLRNQGKLMFANFSVQGPGELRNEAGATITLQSSASPGLTGNVVLTNSGTIECGTALNLTDATVENLVGGTMNFSQWGVYTSHPTHGTLANRGTIRKVGEVGELSEIRPRFTQRAGGVTRVEGGTFQLQGGGELGAGGGLFEVSDGAILRMNPGAYTVSGAGHEIRGAGASPRAEITGSTTVDVQSGGTLLLNVPRGSTNQTGGAFLTSPAALGGVGKVTNRGFLAWSGRVGVNGQASFHNEQGAWTEVPALLAAQLRGTFNNRAHAVLRQNGSLDLAGSVLNNQGSWSARPIASNIAVQGAGGVVHNSGSFMIFGEDTPQTVTFSARLDNSGEVDVENATLNLTGVVDQVQGGALVGGTWRVGPSGRIIFPAGSFTRLAGATVEAYETGMAIMGGLVEIDDGSLTLTDDLSVSGTLTVKGGGKLIVGPGADLTVPGGTSVGTPASGVGFAETRTVVTDVPDPARIITPTLTVYGTIRGGGPDLPGPFNLVGNLAMEGSGRVEMELGGLAPEDEYDRVNVSGNATLSGTLDVRLLPGFVPQLGQTFTVMSCTGTRTGTFASVLKPAGLPAGLDLSVVYGASSATLQLIPGCYANCDHSAVPPVLNILDFSCFLNRFSSGDPSANCDGSTVVPALNIQDFSCFLNRFAAGCS